MGTGKNAIFCCFRCGFTYPWLEAKTELTGNKVCEECYDGHYQLSNHPQGFPPEELGPDSVLEWTNPDARVTVAPPIISFDVFNRSNAFNYTFVSTSSSTGPG